MATAVADTTHRSKPHSGCTIATLARAARGHARKVHDRAVKLRWMNKAGAQKAMASPTEAKQPVGDGASSGVSVKADPGVGLKPGVEAKRGKRKVATTRKTKSPVAPARRSSRKRQRSAVAKYSEEPLNRQEKRLLEIALAMSRQQAVAKSKAWELPEAAIVHPTAEEFADPMEYIKTLRALGHEFGVVKVVPPAGWSPPVNTAVDARWSKRVSTKLQRVHRLQEALPFGDGPDMTLAEFRERALRFEQRAGLPRMHNIGSATLGGHVSMGDDRGRVGGAGCGAGAGAGEVASLAAASPPDVSAQEHHAPGEESGVPGTPPPGKRPRICWELAVGDGPSKEDVKVVEKQFWKTVNGGAGELEVLYANDLSTLDVDIGFQRPMASGAVEADDFQWAAWKVARAAACVDAAEPDYYRRIGWNLHNIAFLPESPLRTLRARVSGINVPWLYLGQQLSSFAWHNEDHYFYSINYLHFGAPKVWYSVPGDQATKMEAQMKTVIPCRFDARPDLLFDLVLVHDPAYFKQAGVAVYRTVQRPGEIILTFPQSYHSGFNTGLNCAEAVNFALPDWIPFGQRCAERYRLWAQQQVLSHVGLVFRFAQTYRPTTVAACDTILLCLRRSLSGMVEWRSFLSSEGIRNQLCLSLSSPQRVECSVCKHICFATALVCSCSAAAIGCIRHASEMCKCPNLRKCMLVWLQETDFQAVIARIESVKADVRAAVSCGAPPITRPACLQLQGVSAATTCRPPAAPVSTPSVETAVHIAEAAVPRVEAAVPSVTAPSAEAPVCPPSPPVHSWGLEFMPNLSQDTSSLCDWRHVPRACGWDVARR